MFDCYDSIRISQPINTYFLIIGENGSGQCYRNGKPWNYDYTQEKCIASGKTEKEIIISAIKYKRLCNMTMEEYIKSLIT